MNTSWEILHSRPECSWIESKHHFLLLLGSKRIVQKVFLYLSEIMLTKIASKYLQGIFLHSKAYLEHDSSEYYLEK